MPRPEMEKRKHILFISSWYPNRYNPTHGIFNRFFADAVALYNRVSVLHVCSDPHLKSEFELVESFEGGVHTVVVYYKKITHTTPLLSQFARRKRVLRAFDKGYALLAQKAGKPDLIQLNVIMPMGIGAYHLSKKHNIPYVVNENWSGYCADDGNYKGLLQQYYTRKIVKAAKAIMPTSTYLQEAMLSHGLTGNYQVVPNVVNIHNFKPAATETKSGIRLIHISSLNDREKNVSGIIRAFSNACKKNAQLHLTLVGEGIDKEHYQSLVASLGLTSCVTFTGRLLSEDLVQEINKHDALIMFSNYETFCLVIVEAFACGKPVITSDAGAIKTYMTPQLGMMVRKRDEEALTQAILQFAEQPAQFDSAFIRKFAVENYSYEVVGNKLDTIYNQVLQLA
jgi:glycosyltransferase involved in cell wall biosynthesis